MSFKYLRRAMENESLGLGDPAELVPETAVELSDGVAAAIEEEAEMADMVGDIDAGADAAEHIEADTEILEATLDPQSTESGQEEGASPETIAVAQESIGRILTKLGIPRAQVFPSLESFSGRNRSARITATRHAIEGFKETVKNIWQAIKDMFKKLWEKIKGFFGRFFQNAEKLEKRAEEVKKTIFERTNGKKATEKVKNQGIANKLHDKEGKCTFAAVQEILKAMTTFQDFSKNVGSGISTLINNAKTDILATLTSAPNSGAVSDPKYAEKVNDSIKKISTITRNTVIELFKKHGGFPTADTSILERWKSEFEGYEWDPSTSLTVSGPFVDGKYLVSKIFVKKGKDGQEKDMLTAMSFKISFEEPSDAKKAEETMEVLTAQEMGSICDSVKTLAAATKAFQKEAKTADGVMSAAIAVAENAIKLAETTNENADPVTKNAISIVKGVVQGSGGSIQTISTSLPVAMVSGGHKALDYVVASMKLYK